MSKITTGLRLAKNAARLSTYPRVTMGAIIMKNSTIIGVGNNLMKTSPKQKKYNHFRGFEPPHGNTIHAEVSAILNCNTSMVGAEIFVQRIMKNGTTGISKPCIACHNAIKDAGITKVWYHDENGNLLNYKV